MKGKKADLPIVNPMLGALFVLENVKMIAEIFRCRLTKSFFFCMDFYRKIVGLQQDIRRKH